MEYGDSDTEPVAGSTSAGPDPTEDAPDGPVTFDRTPFDVPDLGQLSAVLPFQGDDLRKTQMIRARVRQVAKVHGAEVSDLGPERPDLRQRRELSVTQAVRFRANRHRQPRKSGQQEMLRPVRKRPVGQLAAQDGAFLFGMALLFSVQMAFHVGDGMQAGWVVVLVMSPPIVFGALGVALSYWLDDMAKEDRHRFEAESLKHARAFSKLKKFGQKLRKAD